MDRGVINLCLRQLSAPARGLLSHLQITQIFPLHENPSCELLFGQLSSLIGISFLIDLLVPQLPSHNASAQEATALYGRSTAASFGGNKTFFPVASPILPKIVLTPLLFN